MTTRDAEVTRARIIEAAEATFAAQGIAGARVDDIAARAAVNKRMLYYYFDSKEGLYEAVLRRRLAGRREVFASLPGTAEERLPARMAEALADPTYLRLLVWEALSVGPTGEVVAEPERAEALADLAALYQREGDPVDGAQRVLVELGITVAAVVFPQVARMLTGTAVDDPAFAAAHARALAEVGRRLDAGGDDAG